ncbi:polymer-forming cytoskeletal protein [Tropicimonas sp. IMCC34011]|uniref:bactofilin family protein n=1 Tax=Tropicimonas sp. IMCC34011 TaxID=2248759 RepID=UPI000E26811E|nr:polymer-forming cytoskeletal protein [Tropicimonas sp. IMCC34011]
MFSKSRINEPAKPGETEAPSRSETTHVPTGSKTGTDHKPPQSAPKAKPPASVLSSDLTITGNIKTTGDVQVEGTIEGDIRAHLLTVGEGATIRGECIADDVVVNGRIIGRVRGLKVRLTSTARVEGDIIHKTIAIESGAHFEGSVQRRDDPLATQSGGARAPATSHGGDDDGARQSHQPRPQKATS